MNEDRKKIWDEYKGPKDKMLERMFLVYDRYYEANLIVEELEWRGLKFADLKVLDYGCGVGDYGIILARKGAGVGFFDINALYIGFAVWRLIREGIAPHLGAHDDPDLVILGEVLEHLESPLAMIEGIDEFKTKYIFTSSYPYRSDDPNDSYWQKSGHTDKARLEQPACRETLLRSYEKIKLGGTRAEFNLWIRK